MSAPATSAFVFICYSSKDGEFKDELMSQLGVTLQEHEIFDFDRSNRPGENWRAKVEKALEDAAVAILVVSPNSLSSRFIRDVEIKRLLERRNQEKSCCVIPLIYRKCAWKLVDGLSDLHVHPKGEEPLSRKSQDDRDDALTELTTFVARIVGPATDTRRSSRAPDRAIALAVRENRRSSRVRPRVRQLRVGGAGGGAGAAIHAREGTDKGIRQDDRWKPARGGDPPQEPWPELIRRPGTKTQPDLATKGPKSGEHDLPKLPKAAG